MGCCTGTEIKLFAVYIIQNHRPDETSDKRRCSNLAMGWMLIAVVVVASVQSVSTF